MKKTIASILVVAVLGGLTYWGASRHVVRTEEGVVVLSKRFLAFADTAVDVRRWTSDDFDAHPELKKALIDEGYGDMLERLRARERKAALEGMADKAEAAAGEFAGKVSDMAGDVAAEVSETAGAIATKVSEKAGEVADKVAETLGTE